MTREKMTNRYHLYITSTPPRLALCLSEMASSAFHKRRILPSGGEITESILELARAA